jgi:uncharacterized protein YndB with AHSA1/START domain
MRRDIRIRNWSAFLQDFTETHRAQPVTLEVLEGATWKIQEAGMPLVGLDLDTKAKDAPALEIFLGDEASGERRHLAHTVNHVKRVTAEGNRENVDRLVIEGGDGTQAVLSID